MNKVFEDFIDKHKDLKPNGLIKKLFDCIDTPYEPVSLRYFGQAWLHGLIRGMHGRRPADFAFVLCGKAGIGKTEFFKKLLPEELENYYSTLEPENTKENWLTISCNLISVFDGISVSSPHQTGIVNDLVRKNNFRIRKPYHETSSEMVRMASIAGTSNEFAKYPQDSIVFINCLDIDKSAYNSIDKTSLFMEAYWL